MAEPYNLSAIMNATSLDKIMVASNTFTDSTFGLFCLLAIWIIIFLRLKNYDMKVASFVASFATAICGLLFMLIQMISFEWFLACVLILGVTALFNKFDE